jgi:hypothetical protein
MELRCRSRFSRSRCCSRFEFSYRCYVLWVSYMAIVAMDAHGRCCFPIVTSRGQCPSAIKCRPKLLSNRTRAKRYLPRRTFRAAACAVNNRCIPPNRTPDVLSRIVVWQTGGMPRLKTNVQEARCNDWCRRGGLQLRRQFPYGLQYRDEMIKQSARPGSNLPDGLSKPTG